MDAKSKNWAVRVALAATYRLLEREGLNEGIHNHATALAPAASGEGEVMLIMPNGVHWSQVTASCLLGYSIEKQELVEGSGELFFVGLNTDVPIYKKRPDVRCIVHVHAPYSTAIALRKDFTRLPMTHQNAVFFYGKTAIDFDYNGQASSMREGERISDILKDNNVLFLKHHGIIVVGRSVAWALHNTYYLEQACMFDVLAASAGRELDEIPDEMVAKTSKQHAERADDALVDSFFTAMMSSLKKPAAFDS